MSRVSLILPTAPGDPRPDDAASALRSALEGLGHHVDVVIARGPGAPPAPARGPGVRDVQARDPGLASAAMAGLEVATGDILVLADARVGYDAEALAAVVAPLADGRADLVVASRNLPGGSSGWFGRALGKAARPFTGSTDPLSGLVGVTREALDASFDSFRAVGSRYSLELLGKVEGTRQDVPARAEGPGRGRLPGWDDVRHLKRLADHRYGNASRLLQFCFVGATGMVVDLTCYAAFMNVLERTPLADHVVYPTKVNLALAVAAGMAVAVALAWNFSLNRRLTFSYARKGSILRQFAGYAASNLLGVMVSLGFRLLLPRKVAFFNDHKLAAAVVGIVVATGISFSMSRWVVFRRRPGDDAAEPRAAAEPDPAELAPSAAVQDAV